MRVTFIHAGVARNCHLRMAEPQLQVVSPSHVGLLFRHQPLSPSSNCKLQCNAKVKMSHEVSANSLFSVNGLVAVVTGGGTGTSLRTPTPGNLQLN
jgi:hypothetical protein